MGAPRAKRYLVHPSRKRLAVWAEAGDASIDAHIETCNRCVAVVEEIAQPERSIAEALTLALVTPTNLGARLTTGINRKLQARADMTLIGEMMSLPFRAVRLLSEDDGPIPGSH